MTSFGDRVKQIRFAFGLNQKQVAEIGKTVVQNVSRWEKGAFEPRDAVKLSIANSLHLSLDWLVSGVGIPFQELSVASLKPQAKHFQQMLELISLAFHESKRVDVGFDIDSRGNIIYFLRFSLFVKTVCFSVLYVPLGYERSLQAFITNLANVHQHGDINCSDDEKCTPTYEALETCFSRFVSRAPAFHNKDYFFIRLYNATDKKQLTDLIYARDVSFMDRLNARILLLKIFPESLDAFRHHHKEFRKIVKTWIQGKSFSDKQWSIIDNFVSQEAISAILPRHKKDYFEMFLVRGMKSNKLEPFTFAYAELLNLILTEKKGDSIHKPSIDEKKDQLYWPGEM